MIERSRSTNLEASTARSEVEGRFNKIHTTAADIDKKIQSMNPEQKNRFTEGLKSMFLPDSVDREMRGPGFAVFGMMGGFGVAMETMTEKFGDPSLITTQMREAAEKLQSLPVWDTFDAVSYILLQSFGNSSRAMAIGGAVGVATCISGWIAEKIKERKPR
jgi:hypothetical protein